jgi:hypothetical protein
MGAAIAAGVAGARAGARRVKGAEPESVVCMRNDSYIASLALHKVYQLLKDEQASKHHLVRVIDDSGEDYLYPEEYFACTGLSRTGASAMSGVVNKL